MANLNKCHFIGNLTRTPEAITLPSGKIKAELSLAINDRVGGAERTTYLSCTAWEKNATFCTQYLRKGSLVYIEARATQDTWPDKTTGKTRSKTYFMVETIQNLSPRDQSTAPGNPTPPTQHYQQKSNGYQPQQTMQDDDIPF